MKSEYSDLHKSVMHSKMESHVAEKVLKDSIKKSKVQPYKLTQK